MRERHGRCCPHTSHPVQQSSALDAAKVASIFFARSSPSAVWAGSHRRPGPHRYHSRFLLRLRARCALARNPRCIITLTARVVAGLHGGSERPTPRHSPWPSRRGERWGTLPIMYTPGPAALRHRGRPLLMHSGPAGRTRPAASASASAVTRHGCGACAPVDVAHRHTVTLVQGCAPRRSLPRPQKVKGLRPLRGADAPLTFSVRAPAQRSAAAPCAAAQLRATLAASRYAGQKIPQGHFLPLFFIVPLSGDDFFLRPAAAAASTTGDLLPWGLRAPSPRDRIHATASHTAAGEPARLSLS